MREPDPGLVAAARAGDLRAFEQLVVRHQGDVWRLAFHLLRDESAADDATQEAFIRAFKSLRRYRGESKFSTWLFSIARNCALDELRRIQRRGRLVDQLSHDPVPVAPDPGADAAVREALASLPFELREPVVLVDVFGCSYREVAAIVGVPEGTIKSRIHRARERLCDLLMLKRERSGEA